jgi:hypothetical protein
MKPTARRRALFSLGALLFVCVASCRSAPASTVAAAPKPSAAPGTPVAAKACAAPNLVWHKASKTSYESYPAPGSEECVKYSGCLYEGKFAACKAKRPLSWVQSHNIVAVFPNFDQMKLHDVCLRSGTSTLVATAYDTCGDADCSGCCSKNAAPSGNLVDVESFTDARWGVKDGQIEWADLGPTAGAGCD